MRRIAQGLLTQLSEVLLWFWQMDAPQVPRTVVINQNLSGSGPGVKLCLSDMVTDQSPCRRLIQKFSAISTHSGNLKMNTQLQL